MAVGGDELVRVRLPFVEDAAVRLVLVRDLEVGPVGRQDLWW